MAGKSSSDLMVLLKLLRRIILFSIAAYGLARGMPYPTLGLRLAILWAVLYIASGIIDVVFRKLSHSAMVAEEARNQESATEETPNLPATTTK
jgi:hypothetical protein